VRLSLRLSLLSTVKTSLQISHLLENLKTANQKVMMYICNHCKCHHYIFNVHLDVDVDVDVEELRAQASDSMLGDLLISQMQDFSA